MDTKEVDIIEEMVAEVEGLRNRVALLESALQQVLSGAEDHGLFEGRSQEPEWYVNQIREALGEDEVITEDDTGTIEE